MADAAALDAPSLPAPVAPAPAAAGRGWLIGPAVDLGVYSGITFYSAVLVLALSRFVSPIELFCYLNIVCTIAHHGPTWVRVLGDKAMFRERRWEILLFPPAVVAFVHLTRAQPYVALAVVYVWDRWHAVLQNYGFLKLYDAKFGGPRPRFPKLDLAVLFAGAFLMLTFNAGLSSEVFRYLYVIGGPEITDPRVVQGLRGLALAVALPLLAAFAWSARDDARRRGAWNVPKLTYFFSLLGGHLLMNTTASLLLLSCHEKIYHSVQYVVLVQHYDQNRVRKGDRSETTAWFRRISTPRGIPLYLGLLALYVLAIVALDPGVLPRNAYLEQPLAMLGIVAGLTHYYYDSFLWRVRREDVRERL